MAGRSSSGEIRMLQSASFFVAISVRSANAQPSRNWMIKRDRERLPTSKKHFVRQSALLAKVIPNSV